MWAAETDHSTRATNGTQIDSAQDSKVKPKL